MYKLSYLPQMDGFELIENVYKRHIAIHVGGIQFSHTIEEQIGGQLQAGFVLTDIYKEILTFLCSHLFKINSF